MTRDDAIAVLQEHAEALRARGIRHAALFGSTARGNAGPGSDIDILVELAPDAELDAFEYAALKRFIAGLFSGPVDVVNRDALKPHLRRPVNSDAIYAF
jgi:predicted nucleotidyltransferase